MLKLGTIILRVPAASVREYRINWCIAKDKQIPGIGL
jgi:hypothetical protein